uniref:Uncharacterized protein n=1 Tax=Oryza sativa subsp. japonica TaxID=39947 RepID=Q8LHY3_ORYSJ|nr:hypothetical protein [Oryza sativa Japonica Group]
MARVVLGRAWAADAAHGLARHGPRKEKKEKKRRRRRKREAKRYTIAFFPPYDKFWYLDMYFESLKTQMTHPYKFKDRPYTLL